MGLISTQGHLIRRHIAIDTITVRGDLGMESTQMDPLWAFRHVSTPLPRHESGALNNLSRI